MRTEYYDARLLFVLTWFSFIYTISLVTMNELKKIQNMLKEEIQYNVYGGGMDR